MCMCGRVGDYFRQIKTRMDEEGGSRFVCGEYSVQRYEPIVFEVQGCLHVDVSGRDSESEGPSMHVYIACFYVRKLLCDGVLNFSCSV